MSSQDEARSAGAVRDGTRGRSVAARPAPSAAQTPATARAGTPGVTVQVTGRTDTAVGVDDEHDGGAAPSLQAGTASCNEVRLVGRVSGAPQLRELPSGDSLVAWRVVVERPEAGRRSPAGVRSPTVDTLDCVAWTPGLRRTARALRDGDVVEVTGALRRRFWRAGVVASSRTQVEAERVRRVSRPRPT